MSKDMNWQSLTGTVPGTPRIAAVAHFRRLKGPGCLRSHLHKIGIADSPDCTLCDSDYGNHRSYDYDYQLVTNDVAKEPLRSFQDRPFWKLYKGPLRRRSCQSRDCNLPVRCPVRESV
ncbi:hypothetical protein TNCV_4745411 [Trichonephila clavipes]|nr:hypothetical protein TNCV_4745411 [Trichonephila clavipes]